MADHENPQEQEERTAQLRISHRISSVFLALIGVLGAAALAAYLTVPANSPTAPGAATPTVQTVTVAMHDPGCHWFQVGQGLQKSLSIAGPVNLLNQDEAALRIAGPKRVQTDGVGRQVTLAPGSYRITMVDQPPDDNTLHLTVS